MSLTDQFGEELQEEGKGEYAYRPHRHGRDHICCSANLESVFDVSVLQEVEFFVLVYDLLG